MANDTNRKKREAANPILDEVRHVFRSNPNSRFIRGVLRQILADGRVTPQELVRLRQAVLLEQALGLARNRVPVPPAVPARNEMGVSDQQAEAFMRVHAFLASFPGDARALDLVARVLEDGVVTEEELALVETCSEDLDYEQRMRPFTQGRPAPAEPTPQAVPEPAPPAPEPEPYRWKFPEPKFFPGGSSTKRDDGDGD